MELSKSSFSTATCRLFVFLFCFVFYHRIVGLQHYFLLFPGAFSSVQSLNYVWLFVTPWIAAHQASLSITNSRSSPKLMSIESVMPSSHLILCRPLLLLPPIPLSIRVFSNESTLRMRWPKYLLPKIPGLEEYHSSLDIKKRSTCNNTVTPRKKGLLESYNKSIKKTHLVITSLVSHVHCCFKCYLM